MANPSSVLAPYPIFSDLNGDPLSGGYLYIGVANQNPETNPVAVYWDSALSIPVAQPIRTIGGAPSRNGTPSNIYVSITDYSTTVKDSKGRLVSYSPSVSLKLPASVAVGPIDSSDVNYELNSISRTLSEKLGDAISVKDYGAIGDGVTDDTSAIQMAITSSSGKVLVFPPAIYSISGVGITLPSNISIVGFGAILKVSAVPTADLIYAASKINITIDGLTIDADDKVVGSNIGMLAFQLCSNINITNCQFLKMDRFAIVFNGGSNVLIDNNLITKTTASANQNQSILVSNSAGVATNFRITHNTLVNSGINVALEYSEISHNTISNWKFGAGITTEQSPNCRFLTISNNQCHGGSGIDINGYRCGGLENWAPYSTITGNIFNSNSGAGIDQGGARSVITGNICFNNGTSGGGSGIVARYGTASYNAVESVYSGNRCFDTAGAAGTQEYGYQEQSASLSGIVVSGNSFDQNKTGRVSILSSSTTFYGTTITAKTTYDPPSLAAGAVTSTDVSCAGARIGDFVSVSFSLDTQGILFYGFVNASNNIKIWMKNNTGTTIDLASGTIVARCDKTIETANA